jgi:hypothetical protein
MIFYSFHSGVKDKTFAEVIEGYGGDIVCIQGSFFLFRLVKDCLLMSFAATTSETKLKKEDVQKDVVNVPGFDAFLSCAGWSQHGTATFTRRSLVVPVNAEQGLTRERASKASSGQPIGGYYTVPELPHMRKVDSEGRVVTLDCGLFILLNVCVPSLLPRAPALVFPFPVPASWACPGGVC